MLIFLRGQTAVDVNILLPSMLIFSLLVTGPFIFSKESKSGRAYSSGKDGDVVGLGLPFSTESEKESE
jgi:hypothetical protein